MASEDPKMHKEGTPGKRKHATLLILQKIEIIKSLESGKSWNVVVALYNILL